MSSVTSQKCNSSRITGVREAERILHIIMFDKDKLLLKCNIIKSVIMT